MARIYYRNKGGIGNQLFIYFFAKALSLKFGKKIFVDNITGFRKDYYSRKPLVNSVISDSVPDASFFIHFLFRIYRFIPEWFFFVFGVKVISEKISREFICLNDNSIFKNRVIIVDGYFQSYVYFEEFKFDISKSAFIDFNVIDDYQPFYDLITNSNSVSIHVRRYQYDNLLDLNYYNRAINVVNEKFEFVKYFLFTDDIEWCKLNLNNSSFIFIDVINPNEIQELYLMSLCNHSIIANSSFSWWGAYLGNSSSSKIVIAPKKTDIGVLGLLYPDNWLTI